MTDDGTERTELYQLGEDIIRLQMRMIGFGLSFLPRSTRTHLVSAMRETVAAVQATRDHFGPIVQEALDDLDRRAASQSSRERRVRIVRETPEPQPAEETAPPPAE